VVPINRRNEARFANGTPCRRTSSEEFGDPYRGSGDGFPPVGPTLINTDAVAQS
jgi:hypothetical protein